MTRGGGFFAVAAETVSLLEMLEINGQSFMNAVQEMRRIQVIMDQEANAQFLNASIDESIRPRFSSDVAGMIVSIQELHAVTTLMAARRLEWNLNQNPGFTFKDLRDAMTDIGSRLNDELSMVKMFVVNPQNSMWFQPGTFLLGQMVADRFPSMVFELEEAGKCFALGRSTASAFHSMRSLEIAIRALAAFLGVPDPLRPAERNWAYVLKTIKESMDERYPANCRMPGSEGATVEALYASLDAIKNPWRNATMHTENVYQPHEANHIMQCLLVFMGRLATVCDETGQRVEPGTLSLFDASSGGGAAR